MTRVPDRKSREASTIVPDFVNAVNRQDWARLTDLLDPAIKRHSSAAGLSLEGREALVQFLKVEFETFPDAHETIEDIVAEGWKVAVRHRFRGTQNGPLGVFPPSGRRAEADYIAIYRIENGRIKEVWAEWDTLTVLRQLGHVDPDAESGAYASSEHRAGLTRADNDRPANTTSPASMRDRS